MKIQRSIDRFFYYSQTGEKNLHEKQIKIIATKLFCNEIWKKERMKNKPHYYYLWLFVYAMALDNKGGNP